MDPEPEPRPVSASDAPPGHDVSIEVSRRDRRWPAGCGKSLRAAAAATLRDAAMAGGLAPLAGEIGIVLAGDAEARALNRDWRGLDRPTNVLSFPLHLPAPGAPSVMGDVVLAYETVEREALERGLSLRDHAAHMVVHGVLHLLGRDHAKDAEAEAMEALESRIMLGLGLADPYAAPASEETAA